MSLQKNFTITAVICIVVALGYVTLNQHMQRIISRTGTTGQKYNTRVHKNRYRDPNYIRATYPGFWQDRPTPVHEAFAQHRARTLDSCDPTCNQKEPACKATTFWQWYGMINRNKLPYRPFLFRGQYVFEWEKKYLSYPPLIDLETLPSVDMSRVVVENVREGNVTCALYDVLHGRVDLIGKDGNPRTIGDDEVRVWLKMNTGTGYYSAAGQVEDLHNGSYSFSFKCLWPGLTTLHVAIAFPREYLRTVVHQSHVGVTRYIAGLFKNDVAEEVTVCFSTPNIPGRPCVCNITSLHQDTWYCGRPKHPRLTCQDFRSTKSLFLSPPRYVTKAEAKMIKSIPGAATKRAIKHKIMVSTSDNGKKLNLPSCYKISWNVTWEHQMPRGYWSPGRKWNSLLCTEQPLSAGRARQCLRNSDMRIYGDSNGGQMYIYMIKLNNCKKWDKVLWPFRTSCSDRVTKYPVTFSPHEYPLYLSSATMQKRLPYGGLAAQIDKLRTNHRLILVIHYYLHYTPSHFSVLFLRLVALRDALERLYKRYPDAIVAVRGPHITTITWDYNHSIGGDNLGPIVTQMWKEMFARFRHKMIYLDGWDMSIGLQNTDIHPHSSMVHAMFQTLLSFACS